MRQVINPQLQFGEQDIGAIELDPKSRDDIPQLLRGQQHYSACRIMPNGRLAFLQNAP